MSPPKPERLRSPFLWFGGKGHMLAKLLPLVPPGCREYYGQDAADGNGVAESEGGGVVPA